MFTQKPGPAREDQVSECGILNPLPLNGHLYKTDISKMDTKCWPLLFFSHLLRLSMSQTPLQDGK